MSNDTFLNHGQEPTRLLFLACAMLCLALAACQANPQQANPQQASPRQATAQAASSAKKTDAVAFSAAEKNLIARLTPLGPAPLDETNAVAGDPRAQHLGRFLFFDTRLSSNGAVSCATCHQPSHGFSAPTRLGHGLGVTLRHPPSLLNAAYYPWFDWDGRVDSIWAQAFGPLESPEEMGFSRTELAHLMADDPELRAAYEAIFGPMPDISDASRFPARARPVPKNPAHPDNLAWEAMSAKDRQTINRIASNVAKTIAAYVAQLVRADAPFDKFAQRLLDGDSAADRASRKPDEKSALSPAAQRGLKLFVGKAGCIRCHVGPNFSDGSFHNLGLGPREWLSASRQNGGDQGRWVGVTQVKQNTFNALGPYSDDRDGESAKWLHYLKRTAEDHGQFKTPTLRNIALTPPYMHGGHFETLDEVVRFYSILHERGMVGHREEMLVPLGLSQVEIDAIVAFLKSLTGEPLPSELLHPPASPTRP
jgi:cytochrome c peroxidase